MNKNIDENEKTNAKVDEVEQNETNDNKADDSSVEKKETTNDYLEEEPQDNQATKEENVDGDSETDSIDEVKNTDSDDGFKDKYLRLHAEFENYRRRTAKEILDIRATASVDVIDGLLDIVDNFDRAFSEEHQSEDLDTFRTGIDLIRGQLHTKLKDSGLEVINPEGEAFDPKFHEALMMQPSDDVDADTIISVFMKGYKIKEKVLRTAKVVVSSGKAG